MSNLKNITRAADLYQACVLRLIETDNIKPFFLLDVTLYVMQSFALEELQNDDEVAYNALKQNVIDQAEQGGYPLLALIDNITPEQKNENNKSLLLNHLRTYGLSAPFEDGNALFDNMRINK